MLRAAVTAFAVTFAVAPHPSYADCAPSFTEFAPASGAALPANPTVFVFVPTEGAEGLDASFSAGDVRLDTKKVSSNGAFDVYRVRILADHGDVTLQAERRWQFDASYHIGLASSAHAARVVDVEHRASRWTCSHTNIIAIRTDGDAIALRLDWDGGKDPTIVPFASADLGFLSCKGDTAYVNDVRSFDLVAVFADGTERTLGSSKLRIDDEAYRLPVELLSGRGDLSGTVMPVTYDDPMSRRAFGRPDSDHDLDGSGLRAWLMRIAVLVTLGVLLAATRLLRVPKP